VGLWTNTRLAAGDGPIPVITDGSLCCYTSYTIVTCLLYSPLVLESLLGSLLDSLLNSLLESLLERATLESCT
jgi:hypothetical protein